MDKEREFKRFFEFTSLITDVFPRRGARFLDIGIKALLGNALVVNAVKHQAKRRLKKTDRIRRVLIAADLNIGDAVIAGGAVAATGEIFPGAEIDCVIKRSAGVLIRGNPQISNLYPLYEGAPFPLESDLAGLAEIAARGNYDFVINFSPMVDDEVFGNCPVVNYSLMAAELVRNESRHDTAVNNVVYQSYDFIGKLFPDRIPPDFGRNFTGSSVFLSDEAIENANNFLLASGISQDEPIVMINPDASAKFTRMPFDFQLGLLRRFSEMQCSVLLGSGHVEKLIEHELLYSLQPEQRRKITIIPASTALDVYAALVDLSDVFISGDTGPLHIAAARKYSRSSGESLRNATAVLAVFGGTPPRIYGYDSEARGYFPANQDAPSRTFIGESRCRNITCINKTAKTCKEVRCFLSLNPGEVVYDASRYMETSRKEFFREKLRILEK